MFKQFTFADGIEKSKGWGFIGIKQSYGKETIHRQVEA